MHTSSYITPLCFWSLIPRGIWGGSTSALRTGCAGLFTCVLWGKEINLAPWIWTIAGIGKALSVCLGIGPCRGKKGWWHNHVSFAVQRERWMLILIQAIFKLNRNHIKRFIRCSYNIKLETVEKRQWFNQKIVKLLFTMNWKLTLCILDSLRFIYLFIFYMYMIEMLFLLLERIHPCLSCKSWLTGPGPRGSQSFVLSEGQTGVPCV